MIVNPNQLPRFQDQTARNVEKNKQIWRVAQSKGKKCISVDLQL